MLSEIVERKITGFLHVAGGSRLSRYEQALMIADIFQFDKDLVVKSSIKDMNWSAKRPRDSSLIVDIANNLLSTKPQAFDAAIAEFAMEMGKGVS